MKHIFMIVFCTVLLLSGGCKKQIVEPVSPASISMGEEQSSSISNDAPQQIPEPSGHATNDNEEEQTASEDTDTPHQIEGHKTSIGNVTLSANGTRRFIYTADEIDNLIFRVENASSDIDIFVYNDEEQTELLFSSEYRVSGTERIIVTGLERSRKYYISIVEQDGLDGTFRLYTKTIFDICRHITWGEQCSKLPFDPLEIKSFRIEAGPGTFSLKRIDLTKFTILFFEDESMQKPISLNSHTTPDGIQYSLPGQKNGTDLYVLLSEEKGEKQLSVQGVSLTNSPGAENEGSLSSPQNLTKNVTFPRPCSVAKAGISYYLVAFNGSDMFISLGNNHPATKLILSVYESSCSGTLVGDSISGKGSGFQATLSGGSEASSQVCLKISNFSSSSGVFFDLTVK